MRSQIIRLTLPHPQTISSSEFKRLRDAAATVCTAQYYGYTVPSKNFALPRMNEEICWTIQWPESASRKSRAKILSSLVELSSSTPTSMLVEFREGQLEELTKALEARVCEFAMCCYLPTAPLSDPAFKHSTHKTYTDCYFFRGFEGGQWGNVSDGNDTHGVNISGTEGQDEDKGVGSWDEVLKEEERRIGIYYCGWESIELHEIATATPLFAEEIDKISPYFGPGTGVFYVTFRKHSEVLCYCEFAHHYGDLVKGHVKD